jgi:hypothetical protein
VSANNLLETPPAGKWFLRSFQARISFPAVFKNGSRRRKEADFGANALPPRSSAATALATIFEQIGLRATPLVKPRGGGVRSPGGRTSLNLPGHRIAACLGKAALKTHALQTLTRHPLTRPRARSVWSASDSSALSVLRGTASGSGSQCTVARFRRLRQVLAPVLWRFGNGGGPKAPEDWRTPKPGRASDRSSKIRVSDFGFRLGFGIRISGLLLGAIDLFSQHIH